MIFGAEAGSGATSRPTYPDIAVIAPEGVINR
jgi:hypothetical protein